jgi:outer membrane protein assembly factor BamB
MSRLLIALFVLFGIDSIARAAAEDWPKWLGPRGDNISHEKLPDSWTDGGPKRVWSAKVGEGFASPVAVAGKLYLFTLYDGKSETLTCFDAAGGKSLWHQSYTVDFKPQYNGTRGTPTVEGDRIYTLGEGGDLLCRSLDGGTEIWRSNVLKEAGGKPIMWGCASSPTIVGDRIYVQTGSDGGPIAVAVDKKTGKVEWKSEQADKSGYATIAHVDTKTPQLIVFSGKSVNGVDAASGKTLWSEPVQTEYDVNAATPVFAGGKLFITSEYNSGRSTMFDLGAGGKPKKLWANTNLKSRFQPVVVENGVIYGNGAGTLTCIKWDTGQIAWKGNGDLKKLGAGGSVVRAAGDKLIVLSERGRLSIVRATPEKCEPIGSMPLFDAQQVWTSPLAYDGKVYCKGGDEFVCLDFFSK